MTEEIMLCFLLCTIGQVGIWFFIRNFIRFQVSVDVEEERLTEICEAIEKNHVVTRHIYENLGKYTSDINVMLDTILSTVAFDAKYVKKPSKSKE